MCLCQIRKHYTLTVSRINYLLSKCDHINSETCRDLWAIQRRNSNSSWNIRTIVRSGHGLIFRMTHLH